MFMRPKIIVFDDDPTGSQTVHSCLLLLQWDVETLRLGLKDKAPIFFILANTRAMPETEAIATTKGICQNLKLALKAENITNYLLVSRSDSTLRGHFPAETEAIAAEFGEFDACFHAPAFFEGGRITRDGTHYVQEGENEISVHQTEFAKDSVFGFSHSFLPDYIAEKTKGAIAAKDVDILSMDATADIDAYLKDLAGNKQVVLNAESQADFDRLTPYLFRAASLGKKYIFRSAASLLTSLSQMPPQPVIAEEMGQYRTSTNNGIVFVGSHVEKSTAQLQELLELPTITGVEIDVQQCQETSSRKRLIASVVNTLENCFAEGQTPALYTSRSFCSQPNQAEQIKFGENVTTFFTQLLPFLPRKLGFIISKGGNTTNQILRKGLNLQTVKLLGQILSGCCLVRTDSKDPNFPSLPIVLFPGNVGDRLGLVTVYERLQSNSLK